MPQAVMAVMAVANAGRMLVGSMVAVPSKLGQLSLRQVRNQLGDGHRPRNQRRPLCEVMCQVGSQDFRPM